MKPEEKYFSTMIFFLFVYLNSDTHDKPRTESQKVLLYQYIVPYWLDFAISGSKGREYFLNYSVKILRGGYI